MVTFDEVIRSLDENIQEHEEHFAKQSMIDHLNYAFNQSSYMVVEEKKEIRVVCDNHTTFVRSRNRVDQEEEAFFTDDGWGVTLSTTHAGGLACANFCGAVRNCFHHSQSLHHSQSQDRNESGRFTSKVPRKKRMRVTEKEEEIIKEIREKSDLIYQLQERISELTNLLEWDRERDEGDDSEVLYTLFGNYHNLQFQDYSDLEWAVDLSDEEFLEKLKEAKESRDLEIDHEDCQESLEESIQSFLKNAEPPFEGQGNWVLVCRRCYENWGEDLDFGTEVPGLHDIRVTDRDEKTYNKPALSLSFFSSEEELKEAGL